MTTSDWNTATPIAVADLPQVIAAHLAAHRARDFDAEVACFGEESSVTDDGRTHTGLADIRAWLERATSEFTYTVDLVAAARLDDLRYDAVQHLEGDFPGSVVDLHFRYTLADEDTIARLVIEV